MIRMLIMENQKHLPLQLLRQMQNENQSQNHLYYQYAMMGKPLADSITILI